VKRFPSSVVTLALVLVACGGEEAPEPTAQSESPSIATPEPPAEAGDEGEGAPEPAEDAEPAREACRVPAIPIPRPRECVRGRGYPDCKWQMPHATLADGRYRRWRNTIMEHWWGRPALVSFVMAATHRYRERYPDQVLAVGDLDAPGPRHATHDNGVDVDMYLPGAMMVENAGGGRYPSNHEGKSAAAIEETRQRVEGLARALAECANGALRIYYNDDVVLERFLEWYDAQGFPDNPYGRPMQKHNDLHDFHFHISIAEDMPVLEREPLPDGERDPIQVIEEPPDPSTAPNLASRNRNTTWRAEMEGGMDEGEEPESSMDTTAMESSAMAPTMEPAPTAMSPAPSTPDTSAMSAPSPTAARSEGAATASDG
jgi:hypothetical protein